MSLRYYLITTALAIIITLVIGVTPQKKSSKQLLLIFCYVVGGLALVAGAAVGVARLLAYFGIAESGYIF